ncbi:hypothetical protein AB0399_07925 [Streptomyces sp. NPDC088194]|uniref:hypothetical protein n=1 Tax=Streptomyces sp. NPDC088194 TaxID=3154931 RepID=UPI00344DB502
MNGRMPHRRTPTPLRREPVARRRTPASPRRGPIERFRALYGASPAHLLILLASFAVCGYAAERLLERDWFDVAKWVVGAALLHDLVLLPAYAVADWALHKALGARRSGPRNAVIDHVRVPAFLSLLLLLVYWPLISGARTHYAAATALDPDVFLGRWALITAALFAASGAAFALRRWRAARRPGRGPARADPSG